jgi:hypothetical protein
MADPAERCAECGAELPPEAPRATTDDAVFCETCFARLRAEVERIARAQGENVNWSAAVLGGCLGGAVGVAVWWGFTVLTNIAFGLVAMVIGIAVGKGIVAATGKRSVGLQVLSVSIALASFVVATYLVNRWFINQDPQLAAQGFVVPLVPPTTEFFVQVALAGAGVMDVVFLAIVVWEAWVTVTPLRV